VGYRNYKYFLLFIFYGVVGCFLYMEAGVSLMVSTFTSTRGRVVRALVRACLCACVCVRVRARTASTRLISVCCSYDARLSQSSIHTSVLVFMATIITGAFALTLVREGRDAQAGSAITVRPRLVCCSRSSWHSISTWC
jgi:hypothetical protein